MPSSYEANRNKMNFTEEPNPEAMLAQMIATRGQGAYDLVEPASFYTLAWKEQEVIQPWNENHIHLDDIEPAFLFDQQVVDGKRYSLPSIWGTEAVIFSTKDAPQECSKLSLATLWEEPYIGKLTVRPHSSLAAIGRMLDAQGKLPKPFIDSYKNEESMRANWDVIVGWAIEHKKSVTQFWKSEDEARAAFLTNGCVIGLNWDSTGRALKQPRSSFQLHGAPGWRLPGDFRSMCSLRRTPRTSSRPRHGSISYTHPRARPHLPRKAPASLAS